MWNGSYWYTLGIVTAVDDTHVYIAEQQWKNPEWQGKNYVRKIEITKGRDTILHDDHADWQVAGWKRILSVAK